MFKLGSVLLSLFLCVAATTVQANVGIVYSSEGKKHFSIDVPDSWQVNVGFETDPALMPDGEQPMSRLVTAMPEDSAFMWFGIWVPGDVTNFEEAHEYMESLDITLLSDVVPGEKRSEMINGMKARHFQGTGKKDKELMEYHGMYMQLNENTVVIAIYIGNVEATVKYGDDLKNMMNTLRPVR